MRDNMPLKKKGRKKGGASTDGEKSERTYTIDFATLADNDATVTCASDLCGSKRTVFLEDLFETRLMIVLPRSQASQRRLWEAPTARLQPWLCVQLPRCVCCGTWAVGMAGPWCSVCQSAAFYVLLDSLHV